MISVEQGTFVDKLRQTESKEMVSFFLLFFQPKTLNSNLKIDWKLEGISR